MKLILALVTGAAAFAPIAPFAATSVSALRAEAVEAEAAEEPAAPAYPTINGWTADPNAFCAGLPGNLAPVGDFDPAGFLDGKSVAEIKMLREAEVTHGRVSMLATVGFLVQESGFHPLFNLGGKGIGPAILHLTEVRQNSPFFFEVLALGIGGAEIFRSLYGWVAPKAKGDIAPLSNLKDTDTPFRRLTDDYYPGDVGFDPAGLKPTDAKEFADIATKELQNGRLAMIAVAGFFAQELVNGASILPLQF